MDSSRRKVFQSSNAKLFKQTNQKETFVNYSLALSLYYSIIGGFEL